MTVVVSGVHRSSEVTCYRIKITKVGKSKRIAVLAVQAGIRVWRTRA